MDVFDLVARIRLDASDYENKLGKAKSGMTTLASGVGKGLAIVAKAGAAAVSAGVAGVTALTKMGVDGYAQYEQLVGGVETLFKESGNAVMKYAEKAYQTSGMSANQYMETVTSFSASLIQSLDGDTAKAAKVADMAITDMSDNANKMGTSIEMIQNAYNGFAKGNFTMLDNLKLGYGGTKTEMQRLLKDAQAISGIKYDLSSYADVAEAIHVIQQNMDISGYSVENLTEKIKYQSLTFDEVCKVADSLGVGYEEVRQKMKDGTLTVSDCTALLGTTAREAATTIQGSLSMMKGAWENLVVGMADENANMDVLINNFVDSTATAAQNLIPRIEQTLAGIGQLIEKMAPIISEALPVLVESLLPTIITAGISLITALANAIVEALPAIKTALEEGLVIILTDVFGVSEDRARGFVSGLNKAFGKIADGFRAMVESAQTEGTWLNEIWTGLQNAGLLFKDFLVALWDAISSAFTWCVEQINTEGTYLNTIWENIKTFISAAVQVIQDVIKLFTAVLQGDWTAAWEACQNIAQTVWDAVTNIINNMVEWITGFLGTMVEKGIELINSLSEGMQNKFAEILTLVTGWITDNIVTPIANTVSTFVSTGKQLINSLKTGAVAIFTEILGQAGGWVKNNIVTPIVNKVSDFVSAGKTLINSLKDGALAIFAEILGAAGGWVQDNIITPITNKASDMLSAGKTLLNNFWDGLKSVWSKIASWWDGLKLSDKSANVNVNKNGDGYATGLNYVPYDEFPAILHRGEAVLTAAEARVWRANGLSSATPAMAGGITINQYIQSVPQTPADLANATEAYFEQARWML